MTTPYLAEFIGLASVHLLAVIAPGPDFAVTVSQSVRHGRRMGLLTALGIGCGISVHVAYLFYLAFKLLQAKPTASVQTDTTVQTPAVSDSPSAWRAFSTGFLTNATNPKATLFFLAIFTTLVSDSTPLSIQAFYGAWMCFVNAGWFALVSLLFSQARIRAAFVRMGHWFERLMGIVLAGFAARLVLTQSFTASWLA